MGNTAAQTIGQRGEQIARRYLEGKGFVFIAANWSCKFGEVDLIMRQAGPPNRRTSVPSGTLVFVEVRTRAPTSYGFGFETVAREKQRKLIRTAQYYQQREKWWGDVRFDVVSIVMREPEPEMEHIEHAFEVV